MPDTNTVAADRVVTMHYKLSLDDGQVIDSSEPSEPLSYLHGHSNIVPGLESALEGKSVGDELNVAVKPEEGYGLRQENAIHTVDRSSFPADAELSAGLTFQAADESGNPIMGTIANIEGDAVTVDFNHPLAGVPLNFEIKITGIRAATPEELSQGQAQDSSGDVN